MHFYIELCSDNDDNDDDDDHAAVAGDNVRCRAAMWAGENSWMWRCPVSEIYSTVFRLLSLSQVLVYFIVQQKYLFIYLCVWSFVCFLFVYLFIRLFIYYKTHTKSISVNNDIKYKVLKQLKHQEVGWQIESIAEVISASDKHETKRYTSFTNSSSGSWCTVTDARYQL